MTTANNYLAISHFKEPPLSENKQNIVAKYLILISQNKIYVSVREIIF